MANKGAALHRVEVCKNLKHLNWVVWFYSGQMAFLEVPTTEVFMCYGKQVGMTIMVSNRLEKQLSREKNIHTEWAPFLQANTPFSKGSLGITEDKHRNLSTHL